MQDSRAKTVPCKGRSTHKFCHFLVEPDLVSYICRNIAWMDITIQRAGNRTFWVHLIGLSGWVSMCTHFIGEIHLTCVFRVEVRFLQCFSRIKRRRSRGKVRDIGAGWGQVGVWRLSVECQAWLLTPGSETLTNLIPLELPRTQSSEPHHSRQLANFGTCRFPPRCACQFHSLIRYTRADQQECTDKQLSGFHGYRYLRIVDMSISWQDGYNLFRLHSFPMHMSSGLDHLTTMVTISRGLSSA